MINGLPEKLKEFRRKNGISQRTVAEKLDVSPSIISSYETGERTPSVENLLQLSALYRCSTDYLLGKEKVSHHAVIPVDGLSAKQIHLLTELIETMRSPQ